MNNIIYNVTYDEWKERQREGIETARENGVKFGRKPKEKPKRDILLEYYQCWKHGEMSVRACAEKLNVCNHTCKKWFLALEEELKEEQQR